MEVLLVIAIMLVIVVILVPKETGDRMQANEMAVIRELQIINTMQIQYKSQFQRYATTLAAGDKAGYVFTMAATPGGYTIHANPKVYGRSGYRTFYADQDGLIRQNWSAEPANASSPEFK